MTPEEIVAKFAHSLEQFKPISGQPSESDLTRIRESATPLILQILYDETGAVHNLIGFIWPEAAYVALYGAAFPKPARVGACDPSVDHDATDVVRALTDRATYETAQRETVQFVLAVVADTWLHKLLDTETIYTKVAPKDLLFHLQLGCTGRHALDLLALHNEMQC